jgi:hypothetical protein
MSVVSLCIHLFDNIVDSEGYCNHTFIQRKAGSVVTSHAFTFVGYHNCVPTSEKQPNNQQQVNTIAGHAMQGMCYIPCMI